MYERLHPVFADVDDTLCICPKSLESKITEKTKAVIYVGMGGNTGNFDEILAVCKKHNLKLILDAAHMSGAKYYGKHVGADADVTVFSFQAVKNLPTADSGMICWKEKEDDERARKLCWLGINKDTYARTGAQGNYKWMYDVEEVGFKYHGNSIMAGIGLVQLKYLDEENAYRRKLSDRYRKNLSVNSDIKLVTIPNYCESSSHLFQIRIKNRDGMLKHLNDHEIFPGVHYRDNCEYRMYAHGKGTTPNATQASNELISLPLHMKLTESDVDKISQCILEGMKSV
jgi:dTDP-4-amino-4,6-dideoxygalactose transaminase